MSIYFCTSVVPDNEKYQNSALNRSGNNALLGISDALWKEGDCTIESCTPIPSYPRERLWIPGCVEVFPNGMEVNMLPTLNLKVLKNYYWGLASFFRIIKWRLKNKGKECAAIVYNLYSVPIELLYIVCKISNVKLYAILYDLGVPPKQLGLSKSTMMAYHLGEYFAKFFIKRLDGRIVINESIIKHYAPNEHYVLIDGGINEQIINRLFPLEPSENSDFVFVCAGMLWEQNGTRLILETLKQYPSLSIKVIFAGKGNDVELIKESAKRDNRITYLGMLTIEQLFKVYERADVLLNLRIEEEIDFHFPSKLLEYLATGKYVISTSIAHAERDYGSLMGILKDITPQGLAKKMTETMGMGKYKLYEIGKSARDYMLKYRTWSYRTTEILNYIEKCNNKQAK